MTAAPRRLRLSRQVRVLLVRKELRQFVRSRTALLTGLLLPALIMVIAPVVQLIAATAGSAVRASSLPPAAVPGLSGLGQLSDLFLYFTFPLFFVLGGLMTPSLAATHTVISERERRTIELLVALPVSVTDILTAKMSANLLVAGVTLLPLFVIDAAAVLMLTNAGPLYVMAALLLVVSSLTASIGISLLLALLARDFRTANNLNGFFVVPTMLMTAACVTLVPGLWRFVVLSLLMLALGGAAYLVASRWLTFERYLT
ncbi:MAG TPA: ABC transporter permease subunit [Candidatus Dormibacteraeota bacterium]|nr:ABC transporter permease subunit [Candidatus Dormibacteraeota bacterium]